VAARRFRAGVRMASPASRNKRLLLLSGGGIRVHCGRNLSEVIRAHLGGSTTSVTTRLGRADAVFRDQRKSLFVLKAELRGRGCWSLRLKLRRKLTAKAMTGDDEFEVECVGFCADNLNSPSGLGNWVSDFNSGQFISREALRRCYIPMKSRCVLTALRVDPFFVLGITRPKEHC